MDIADFGISRLALIPVRKNASHASAMVYQLLFGEHYEVLAASADKHWRRIRAVSDGAEGWIDAGHHHSIAREYFDQISHADFKITTDITATILYKKSALTILLGSIVPISSSELFKMEEQLAFNGESKSLGQKRDGEFLGATALKYINAPFLPGGRSPFGIDAPGLVQLVFKIAGYAVARTIEQLAENGKAVAGPEDARCGDVAFFENRSGKVDYCGIALGADRIIHPFGRVRIDHLNEEGILNPETRIYTHRLSGIRRFTGE